jgi:hypothetical protein
MIAEEKQLADHIRERQMPEFGARWGLGNKGYLPFGTLRVCPIVVVLYIPCGAINSCIRRKCHYNWVCRFMYTLCCLQRRLLEKRGCRPNKYESGEGVGVAGVVGVDSRILPADIPEDFLSAPAKSSEGPEGWDGGGGSKKVYSGSWDSMTPVKRVLVAAWGSV